MCWVATSGFDRQLTGEAEQVGIDIPFREPEPITAELADASIQIGFGWSLNDASPRPEILSATPEQYRDWLQKKLRYSNELRRRLEDVLNGVPSLPTRRSAGSQSTRNGLFKPNHPPRDPHGAAHNPEVAG